MPLAKLQRWERAQCVPELSGLEELERKIRRGAFGEGKLSSGRGRALDSQQSLESLLTNEVRQEPIFNDMVISCGKCHREHELRTKDGHWLRSLWTKV